MLSRCPSRAPSATARSSVHNRRMSWLGNKYLLSARDAKTGAQEADVLSDDYNEEMQNKMGTTLTYRHEDGMNYNLITEDIIVGSCLQTPEDADKLATETGVKTVVCLQQDTDMEYFSLDIEPVQEKCAEVGLQHMRLRINDFDPFDLRIRLPEVIKDMHAAHAANGGIAYVHCTAGMGRAPAVALAYMWWVQGIPLEEAYVMLLSKRACSPKLYAIRQAAADVLYGGDPQEIVIRKKGSSRSAKVEIAGLNIGWGNRLEMANVGADVWEAKCTLPPGVFPFKFIMDDVWSYDADMYTVFDGENTNNVVEAIPSGLTDAQLVARERVMKTDGILTGSEIETLHKYLGVRATEPLSAV